MNYFEELSNTLSRLDKDEHGFFHAEVVSLHTELIKKCSERDGWSKTNLIDPRGEKGPQPRIFIAGNGGSASSANHLTCDFQKGLGLDCHSLCSNMALITAWSNDTNYEEVFSNQLMSLGKKGDLVLLLSGSGNSPNILKAAETAAYLGITSLGWCRTGGQLLKNVDYPLEIPIDKEHPASMQIAEDIHMILGHRIYLEILKNK